MTDEGRKTTGKGQAARDSILNAATKLFADKGVEAVSITEIAHAAGVNRAMISYYFGGKSALYDAIISAAVADASAALQSLNVEASGAQGIRTLVLAMAEMLQRRPHVGKMVMREYLQPERMFGVETANRLGGFMALTERVLAAAPLSERARRYDLQVVHLILVGALNYFLLTEPYRTRFGGKLNHPLSQPTVDQFANTLADVLSIGLTVDSAQSG